MSIKRILKLHRIFIGQEIKKALEYKADFIIGIFSLIIRQLCTLLFIWIVFNHITMLDGFSLYEVIFIYGFALLPKAIDHMFLDRFWDLAYGVIKKGEFDKYLTRPINPLITVLMEQFQLDAIGEVITGIAFIIVGAVKAGIAWTFWRILFLMIIIPFAGMIYTAVKILTTALAFWVKQSGSIVFMFYMVNDFAKYPVGIYNRVIRTIITYIIPFALTAYFPAQYLIRGTNPLFNIGMPLLVSVVFMSVAVWVWNRGISAYESAGS